MSGNVVQLFDNSRRRKPELIVSNTIKKQTREQTLHKECRTHLLVLYTVTADLEGYFESKHEFFGQSYDPNEGLINLLKNIKDFITNPETSEYMKQLLGRYSNFYYDLALFKQSAKTKDNVTLRGIVNELISMKPTATQK